MITISQEQIVELDEALRSAFNTNSFERMVRLQLNKKVDEIAGTGNPFKITVYRTITAAEAEGWFFDLVEAACQAVPRNPALKNYAEQFLAFTPLDDPLERMIVGSSTFQDMSPWRQRLWEIEGQVCNIRIDGAFEGTGFLVGPDVVMTNYHVIEDVRHTFRNEDGTEEERGEIDPSTIEMVFDYKRTPQGVVNEGTTYNVAAGAWLIDSSPYSALDRVPREKRIEEPKPTELDYALLRADGMPGDEKRGFVQVTGKKIVYRKDMACHIPQHPQDQYDKKRQMPLQLALQTNADVEVNGNQTRVYYRTNTLRGSSGSPCFDNDWNLIALHHSGDPDKVRAATYNEGIPIQTIYKHVVVDKEKDNVFT